MICPSTTEHALGVLSAHTFVESVHVKLSDEGGDIGVFKVLAEISISSPVSPLGFLAGGRQH